MWLQGVWEGGVRKLRGAIWSSRRHCCYAGPQGRGYSRVGHRAGPQGQADHRGTWNTRPPRPLRPPRPSRPQRPQRSPRPPRVWLDQSGAQGRTTRPAQGCWDEAGFCYKSLFCGPCVWQSLILNFIGWLSYTFQIASFFWCPCWLHHTYHRAWFRRSRSHSFCALWHWLSNVFPLDVFCFALEITCQFS